MSSINNHKSLFLLLALLAVLVASIGLFVGNSVFAGHVPPSLAGSNFEIDADANLTNDALHGGSIDWEDVGLGGLKKDDVPSGSGDTAFGSGTKEGTAVPLSVTGSIPPNKSDLKTFGVYVEDTGAKKFMHLFWTRVQNPKGTTNMDFEFNQSDVDSANGVTPVRTHGDLLIEYKLSKGGTVPNLFLHLWIDGSGGETAADCEAASSLPCWKEKADLTAAGDAAGSINTNGISAGDSFSLGPLDPFTFGEATLDLDVILDPNKCTSFGSAYLKSRSSDSFTAALKDYIAPLPVNISNCGQVIIHKVTDPTPTAVDFNFTTDVASDPAHTGSFILHDGKTETISNVLAGGPYHVVELDSAGAGYVLTDIDCSAGTVTPTSASTETRTVTFNMLVGESLECTFTNTGLGSLTIVKDAIPDDVQDFIFTRSFGANFILDDDGGETNPDNSRITFPNLVAGQIYSVGENAVTGWDQTNISCSGASSYTTTGASSDTSFQPGDDTVNVTLGVGEDVTCTFTNTGLYNLIVITCSAVDNTLVLSGAYLSGALGGPADTALEGNNGVVDTMLEDTGGTPHNIDSLELERYLCSELAGARYTNLPGNGVNPNALEVTPYSLKVEIPK